MFYCWGSAIHPPAISVQGSITIYCTNRSNFQALQQVASQDSVLSFCRSQLYWIYSPQLAHFCFQNQFWYTGIHFFFPVLFFFFSLQTQLGKKIKPPLTFMSQCFKESIGRISSIVTCIFRDLEAFIASHFWQAQEVAQKIPEDAKVFGLRLETELGKNSSFY